MAKRVRDGSKELHWRQVLARWRSSELSARAYRELRRIPQPERLRGVGGFAGSDRLWRWVVQDVSRCR